MSRPRVIVVPCSGIGKSYGTVSREAAFEVVEELRPETTQIVALSLLVLGDDATRAAVAAAPVITMDGCTLGCASKMVEESGGHVTRAFRVMDVYRDHREYKPQGIAELNEGGQRLARVLAEEVAEEVDLLLSDRSRAEASEEA